MSAPCKCVEIVNKKLATRNTILEQAIVMGDHHGDSLMIKTRQVEVGRGEPRPVAMFASFCPFCGQSYDARNGEGVDPEVQAYQAKYLDENDQWGNWQQCSKERYERRELLPSYKIGRAKFRLLYARDGFA
jgi:hypothetical protein